MKITREQMLPLMEESGALGDLDINEKDFLGGHGREQTYVALIERTLRDVPDVKPFRFAGYPDNETFIHSTCGTVVDVVPGSDLWDQVQAGECDCENTAPWFRIFVEAEK